MRGKSIQGEIFVSNMSKELERSAKEMSCKRIQSRKTCLTLHPMSRARLTLILSLSVAD